MVSRLILTRQEHDKEKVSAYYHHLYLSVPFAYSVYIYVLVYLFDYLQVIYYFGL